MQESVGPQVSQREAPALSTASKEGTQQISLQQLFEQLHTSEKGLTSEEARRKLSEVGPNELITVQRIAGVKQLLHPLEPARYNLAGCEYHFWLFR